MDENKFPKNFLWGAAISSYQTEGNNSNSDWWEWEQKGKTKDKSGMACDYWNRYKEDNNLVQELGCNVFRLSLEWSRIEPSEGKFSSEAIEHYREILQDLKKRNIKTAVTFWHWTSPIWFQENYGLHLDKSVGIFVRYGKKVIDEFGDLMDFAIVFNEPMMPLGVGFLAGKFPPGKHNYFAFRRAFNNLASIYLQLYDYIKNKKNIPIGITTLYNLFEPEHKHNFFERLAAKICDNFWNKSFFEKIKSKTDFYGLDYYIHQQLSITGLKHHKKTMTDMGWEIYPEGLYRATKEIFEKYHLPIYIFENGIADEKDLYRSQFIRDHIEQTLRAIREGIDIRGYFYWSLIDNFEWTYGFKMKFGLVEIDRQTLERQPRKSFYFYKDLIKKYSEQ